MSTKEVMFSSSFVILLAELYKNYPRVSQKLVERWHIGQDRND